MACMPMLSRLLLIVYGGIGDTIPMVGGAVIPTMVGDGTAGTVRAGASAGVAGTVAVGGAITIITTIPIITVGIMEAAIGVAAMAGTVEVFIPIAAIRVREAPMWCTEAMVAGVREPMAGRTGAMRKVLHVA